MVVYFWESLIFFTASSIQYKHAIAIESWCVTSYNWNKGHNNGFGDAHSLGLFLVGFFSDVIHLEVS